MNPFYRWSAGSATVAWLGSACMALAQPVLTVQRNSAAVPADATVEFGTVVSTMLWAYDFTLTNTGNQPLTQISISQVAGCNSEVSPPVSLQPGQSATMSMSIHTTPVGPLAGSFTLASNSAQNPSYKINFTATSTTVVSPVFNSPTDVPYPGGGIMPSTHTFGQLTLGFAPQPGTVLTAIQTINSLRRLQNLPDGSIVTADFNGVTYSFVAGYKGGAAGNSLILTLLGGDGVLNKSIPISFVTAPIAVEDDGAFLYGMGRKDAAGGFDPVFKSPSNLGTPSYLTLVNGDTYHATDSIVSPKLVRLRNDGSTDTTFNATINGHVRGMAALPDGRLMIGGNFTTVSGQTRKSLAMLFPDGSVDPSFDPQFDLSDYHVSTLAVQADGKVLVGTVNPFVISAIPSTNLIRFMPDGAVDTSFTLATSLVDRLLTQPDGKIVIVSFSTSISPTNRVRRFHADGSPDSGFSASPNGTIREIALLADGKFLLCGYFTSIGGHACTGLARIHPDGSPDPTFAPQLGNYASQVLVNGKNNIWILGDLKSVNGVGMPAQDAMAELNNPTASTQVQLVDANTVRWTRQGGAAELQWVKAELIPENGAPVSLGLAQRVSGGWEVTSPTPISNATVRLYGPAIHTNGMTVMVKELLEVGTVTPQLVATKDQLILSPATTNPLGTFRAGKESSVLVRMENRGAGTLAAPVVSIEGTHASEFTLVQSSATDLKAGEQRSLLLKIYPTGGGTRTAQLRFQSAEAGAPLQIIPLSIQSDDQLNATFNSASDTIITQEGFDATHLNFGTLALNFAPTPGTILTLVSNTSSSAITGQLKSPLPPGIVSADYNGVTYHFGLNYTGGTGNDLTLKLLGNGDIAPGFQGGADNQVHGVTIQPDGKVIVAGHFDKIGNTPRAGIARLYPDGTVDSTFNASLDGQVENIVILDDDRILFTGGYKVNGVDDYDLMVLNQDGSFSEGFDLAFEVPEGRFPIVTRLLKLRSGKILVGGSFDTVGGQPRKNLARLNADGTLDMTFSPVIAGQSPNNGNVYAIHEQADGKLLIGGSFGSVNGNTRYCLARLNADGSLDPDFNPLFGPNTSNTTGDAFGTRVSTVTQLADGKICVGGKFSVISGTSRNNFACLNADGTVDTTFNLAANDVVTCMNLQADGHLLVGGLFTTFGGQQRSRIVRVRSNGIVDPDFAPKASGTVSGMTLDREGNLWVTGIFTNMNGVTVTGLAKLRNDTGSTALSINTSTSALWEVSGTAPALRGVKFELSTDGGVVWTPLGNGSKVINGWSLGGITLPASGYLRASGIAIGGNRGFSAIEDVILFGRQPTKIEQWRMDIFGSYTNQRTGADLVDADGDGVRNVMEYAFGLDPQNPNSAQVPAWTNDAAKFEIAFTPPANVEGMVYGVEWSPTMDPSDWHDVTNQGTSGGHHYVVPKDATPMKFMRVKVTNTSDQ